MCGKGMDMMKACGKMLSKVRLEKNWGTSVNGRAIYYQILNFLGNLENSLCCPNFPCVVPKFPVFSLSGKSDNQIPCFPCAVATLYDYLTCLIISEIDIICFGAITGGGGGGGGGGGPPGGGGGGPPGAVGTGGGGGMAPAVPAARPKEREGYNKHSNHSKDLNDKLRQFENEMKAPYIWREHRIVP